MVEDNLVKRKNPSNKWLLGLLVIFILALLIGAVIILSKRSMKKFFAEDAVQVIAYRVSDLYRNNPSTSQKDIEEAIKGLHDGSVINLMVNNEGKAVDPFGTPFKVEHEKKPSISITSVTSAGPDQTFGTEDDIMYVYEAPYD